MKYNVVIIGGGPAGLMAAVSAATHGASVVIVDKGKKLGRKLAISGGGRCNVTNRMEQKELIDHIPGNGKFMHSPFSVFNNEDIIAFFENLGIELKEEDMGRMFPVNDKAMTVVQTLLDKIAKLGVDTRLQTKVDSLLLEEEKTTGVMLEGGEQLHADAVIIATGGKSVPNTGSTGDGYPWAKAAGHTITELYPTEVPITSDESFIKDKTLQGISLSNAALTVYNPKGKKIKTHRGDMIFTHFGISGPIVLRCSQFVVKALKKHQTKTIPMGISIYPDTNTEDMFQKLLERKKQEGAKASKNALKNIAAERLLSFFLKKADIVETKALQDISNDSLRTLAGLLTDFRFEVNGTLSIEDAFVTGGGISIKEIYPKRMESKYKSGLYFCGEILDIHAYTGGFNITCAFSTGYTAGKAAAESIAEANTFSP
ncbi:NAD(P)/FAD-dependent oxidoreductase [Salibacterium salarium]|uniref:NAD(P)/FAD-dependent oxidoreductase n=1 Tax=Salibacterium salarium TaxID=284579 RepID=A0A428N768_9BACI|nr:NAD(P)/FAD-dependent oxidoreductase [Salibacterium salarium]RSL34219.1 NAD(P)/FAD-dependent oxidoreductase [Salibacterium salarium]